jgi:hypothetical protein
LGEIFPKNNKQNVKVFEITKSNKKLMHRI